MPTLTLYTQENTISLLAFSEDYYQLVRNSVTPELYDSPYNVIVEKCISYIDRYNKPPRDHIADELEKQLQGPEAEKFREVLIAINHLKDNINGKYVLESLTKFVASQRFINAMYDAAALQAKGQLEEAQEAIRGALDTNLTLFDPGIKLTDYHRLAKSLQEEEIYPSGIHALDKMKVGPAAGQMLVMLGARSCGKSWSFIGMGKMAAFLGLKVAHITLEIDPDHLLERYIQNILAITRWQYGAIKSPLFVRDGNNAIIRVDQAVINPRHLDESNILDYIESSLHKISGRLEQNVRIKGFPGGQLTMPMLRGYLDGLERTQNFIPNLVILDQAINMEIPVKEMRQALGRLYVNLRGLAVERNFALVTGHHINRAGAKAKITTGEDIAEDWSILGTVDTGLVYNRRPAEEKYKLARIFVDRARTMRSRFWVLMAQNYDTGQFCLDSEKLPDVYNPDAGMTGQEDLTHMASEPTATEEGMNEDSTDE